MKKAKNSTITINRNYLLFIAGIIVVVGCVGAVIFYNLKSVRLAVYGRVQTDRNGGASTTAATAHPGDETGWTGYYSEDTVISTSTPGKISLASTTVSRIENASEDFGIRTIDKVYASSGAVWLKKPVGTACAAGSECTSGYCNTSGICSTCEDFTYSSYTYSVVIIGEQCWMAENLRIGSTTDSIYTASMHSDMTNDGIIERYCYENNESNCDAEGGLYDWDEMMGYTTDEGAQGICPSGWHIPTDAEFYTLENGLATAACSASREDWGCDSAGTALKEYGSSGFEALFAGNRHNGGEFTIRGSSIDIWSSSVTGDNAWRRFLYSSESRVNRDSDHREDGFSVRCLRD